MSKGYWFTADRDVILPDETLLVEAITLSTDKATGLYKIERKFEYAADNQANEQIPYEETITLEIPHFGAVDK